MSKIKVGDWVRVNSKALPNENHTHYQVAEIFSDSFGDVMLSTVGGSGYGSYYLEKVKLSQWHPITTKPVNKGWYEIKWLNDETCYIQWNGQWVDGLEYLIKAWRGITQ